MKLIEAKSLFPEQPTTPPPNVFGYIYVTLEPSSGKFYIGKQSNPKWNDNYYGSGKAPKEWISNNLSLVHWPVQWCFSKNELNQAEYDWIDKFKNHKDIMNITVGGENGFTPINNRAKQIRSDSFKGENNPQYGKHLSDETKQKISDTKKEYFKDHDGAWKDKHHTEESKQKLSESLTQYYETHDNPMKGKTHSEEACKKMSESLKKHYETHESKSKGIKHSEQSRKNMSKGCKEYYKTHDAPMKGRKHSEEARQKMREAAKYRSVSSNPIKCVETGVIYPSARDAVKDLNGDCRVYIYEACDGKREKALGYHWVWIL